VVAAANARGAVTVRARGVENAEEHLRGVRSHVSRIASRRVWQSTVIVTVHDIRRSSVARPRDREQCNILSLSLHRTVQWSPVLQPRTWVREFDSSVASRRGTSLPERSSLSSLKRSGDGDVVGKGATPRIYRWVNYRFCIFRRSESIGRYIGAGFTRQALTLSNKNISEQFFVEKRNRLRTLIVSMSNVFMKLFCVDRENALALFLG